MRVITLDINNYARYRKILNKLDSLDIRYDYHSPLPITTSRKSQNSGLIPVFSLFGGFIGAFLGFYFQFWASAVDYKLNLSSKPFFSLITSIPVVFELGILFAALFAVIGFLIASALPSWKMEDKALESYEAEVTGSEFIIIIPELNEMIDKLIDEILN